MKDLFCTKQNLTLLFAGPFAVLIVWVTLLFFNTPSGEWFGLVSSVIVSFAFTGSEVRKKGYFDFSEFFLMIIAGTVSALAIFVITNI